MPNLKLDRETIFAGLEEIREAAHRSLDRELNRVKDEVETLAAVKGGTLPDLKDAELAVVKDITVFAGQSSFVGHVSCSFAGIGQVIGESIAGNQSLKPGRYRIFLHMHKLPE